MSDVLIRPVVTEKINRQTEKFGRYYFIVDRRANKLEIKRAVEQFYGVSVKGVNTITAPAKIKTKFTKAGVITGKKPARKKAVVTLSKGETIDLFGNA
ncbi:MAG TPA: 50S ribosomal protein L23 [Chitinophagaceae bacterium]|nr:50S ribosomal protein L23 [Chitinophagaceae bacterium]